MNYWNFFILLHWGCGVVRLLVLRWYSNSGTWVWPAWEMPPASKSVLHQKKEIKRHSIHTIGNTEHLSQWLQDKELLRTSYWINGDRLIKADSSFENNKSIQLHTKWSHFEYIKLRSSLNILNLHTYTSISILFDILYLISLGYMIQH